MTGERKISEFEGKVILTTGATSGLGATVAVSLAGKGARVAITGRHEERGHAVLKQIEAAGGEWLLSARSSFVNGAAIPLDGGATTRLY